MLENRSLLLRRNATILFGVSGLFLLISELDIVERLWGKGWGATGFGGYVGPYFEPLFVLFPFLFAVVLRFRLKKWEFLGKVSAEVSAQVYLSVAGMLLVTYLAFSELASAR